MVNTTITENENMKIWENVKHKTLITFIIKIKILFYCFLIKKLLNIKEFKNIIFLFLEKS